MPSSRASAATLRAVSSIGMQALVFWANVDAGSDEVAAGIRQFREQGLAQLCQFFRNLPAEDFARLMIHCACMVGTSSAALRDGAYLGTPAEKNVFAKTGSISHVRTISGYVKTKTHGPVTFSFMINQWMGEDQPHGAADLATVRGAILAAIAAQ